MHGDLGNYGIRGGALLGASFTLNDVREAS